MFDFTIRYFGFLKHIPLLPHLFEAFLKIRYFISNKTMLDYLDEIEDEVLSWKQTSAQIHKFGGVQFNLRGKEIGHMHGNGLLDILFSNETKERLLNEGKVKNHHIFTDSGWISFYIRTRQDKDLAVELLRKSYFLKL